jgi:hypothetical protein
MSSEVPAILKSFGTRFMSKAAHSFDRATVVVVSVCWGAAIFMIAFTLYTLHVAAATGNAAETAAASEPILPKVVHKPIDAHDTKPLVDRLQHRYPGLNFSTGSDNSIAISSQDGTKFHDWLNVLRYVDIASPKYRWTLKEFCVGKCSGSLMRAVMVGEVVTFEAPGGGDK